MPRAASPRRAVSKGATYRVTGVAGQRASRKGALDGYRVWLRDAAELASSRRRPIAIVLARRPRRRGRQRARRRDRRRAHPQTRAISVASALRITDRDVVIQAVVTAPASLLDATGRRIVVRDGTGAIEVLLPKDVPAPGVGTRIRLSAGWAPRTVPRGCGRSRWSGSAPGRSRAAARARATQCGTYVAARRGVRSHRRRAQARGSLACRDRGGSGSPGRRRPARCEDPGRGHRGGTLDRADRHRPAGLPERDRSPPDDPAPVPGRRQRQRRTDGRWPDERGIDAAARPVALPAARVVREWRGTRAAAPSARPWPMPTSPTSPRSSATPFASAASSSTSGPTASRSMTDRARAGRAARRSRGLDPAHRDRRTRST